MYDYSIISLSPGGSTPQLVVEVVDRFGVASIASIAHMRRRIAATTGIMAKRAADEDFFGCSNGSSVERRGIGLWIRVAPRLDNQHKSSRKHAQMQIRPGRGEIMEFHPHRQFSPRLFFEFELCKVP